MCKISVVNISGAIKEPYIEALQKDNNKVVLVDFSKDRSTFLLEADVVIIYDEFQERVSETCKLIMSIKEKKDVFIWTLSRKLNEVNSLVYLELGVNGNLKECENPTELQLIIRNLVKRQTAATPSADLNYSKNLQINECNQSVTIYGKKEVSLTKLEFKILLVLYREAGRTVDYEILSEILWREKGCDLNKAGIANIICHLRNKIEIDVKHPQFILNVRSKGYMLRLS
jgi:DNA-binding response OmpR family regulator